MQLLKKLFDPAHILSEKHKIGEPLPTAKQAVGTLLKIAWPSILETFLVSVVSLVDTIMVGTLGHQSIAAVGLTTQPRFIFLAVLMSLNMGVTAVVSRRKGEGDQENANRTLRQALLITAILAIVLSAIGITFSRPLILFAGAQPDTIDEAITYFQIIIGGMFFSAISLTINAAQRGIGNTRISMITNIAANLVNITFNWLLIGGNLGFPRLGVSGAAIATTFGYFVAFVIACFSVSRKGGYLRVRLNQSFMPDKRNLRALFMVGSSVAVEQLIMRIGFFTFAKIVASIGTIAFATHQIVVSLQHISFSFGDGLSIATGSLVGQSLGRKRPDMAMVYGNISQRIGLLMGVVISVVFVSMRRDFVMMFDKTPEIVELGSLLILILAAMCPMQISQVILSSSLRVAGDTRYVARTSLISIAVGRTLLAYILCVPLGFGLIGAWFGFVADQLTRLALNATRFMKGKWTTIKL